MEGRSWSWFRRTRRERCLIRGTAQHGNYEQRPVFEGEERAVSQRNRGIGVRS